MGNVVSGNIVSGPRTAKAIDSYVGELPDVSYEKSLGSSRFMKTIRCKHREGPLVVKIFVKPDPAISLKQTIKEIMVERDILMSIPNALPYQKIMETDRAGYMVRQYVYSNLYDRISTRPFLTLIEKKWIAFQLLSGLSMAHARGVFHGDIKTENVVITSWNWAYLVDFSGFKPIYLPEDNPADYTYFFDTSSRRTCYLAPERFMAPGDMLFSLKQKRFSSAMDIFGLGCTLAELFLEGSPIFSFSQLLRYRANEYDPKPVLEKIEEASVRAMISRMLSLDPEQRGSADQHLSEWRGKIFPEYFYTFLHEHFTTLSDPRQATLASAHTLTVQNVPRTVIADADSKIQLIYESFARIVVALDIPFVDDAPRGPVAVASWKEVYANSKQNVFRGQPVLPMSLNIPGCPTSSSLITRHPDSCDGSILYVAVLCSTIRNAIFPSSKLMALDLLLAFGIHLSDELRLDRVVPFLIALVSDEHAMVRANALKILTQLLGLIESITPNDSNIFPEYILPSLHRFSTDPVVFVRATYAHCISSLADTALRFLELAQLFKDDPTDVDAESDIYMVTYDTALRELHELVKDEVLALLIDSSPQVKRALLFEISRLCIFFGRQKANDLLLGHMITYLNDSDWQLRCAFFESIVGVATFVGARSLEEYILPLIVQSLTDAEEFVVEKVLLALASITDLGLVQRPKLRELVGSVAPLLCHPNVWIRNGAIAFIASTVKRLPTIDVRCMVYPAIRPFLQNDIWEVTELTLIDNVKDPISRTLYDQTINLIAVSSTSVFQGARTKSADSSNQSEDGESDLLRQLREFGITDEDKDKLLAMKHFVSKSTQSRLRRASEIKAPDDTEMKNLGITPRTVFLTAPKYPSHDEILSSPPQGPPRSRNSSAQSTSSIYSRIARVTNESSGRTNSPSLLSNQLQRDHGPSSNSGSGMTTPHRTLGHQKSLSDASILTDSSTVHSGASRPGHQKSTSDASFVEGVDFSKSYVIPLAGSPDSFTAVPRTPTNATNSQARPLSMGSENRPLSLVSDSSLQSPVNRFSQDFSDRASIFSLDRLSVDMSVLSTSSSVKLKSTAVVSLSTETATGTIDARPLQSQSRPSSIIVTPGSPVATARAGYVTEAVVAAAAIGSQKSERRGETASVTSDADAKPSAPPPTGSSTQVVDNGKGFLVVDGVNGLGPEGRDRNIAKLLEAKRREIFPPPLTELGRKVNGPAITPNTAQQRGRRLRTSSSGSELKDWKPEGVLAAHLTEHRGPVNQIALAPDHNFFASCSDDGTVKIWDSQRLERQVTNRARLTYTQQGGKIQAVAFCQNTHSVASASDNGTVHVSRVEYLGSSTPTGAPKYSGIHVVRNHKTAGIDERDYPALLNHYNTDSENVLIYTTALGKICGLDLRSMRPAWTFDNPPHHGSISSFVCDQGHCWILTGTHRGVFSLWDIRFGLKVKSWAHPSRSRVHRINLGGPYTQGGLGGSRGSSMLASFTSSSKTVLAAVGDRTNEVSMWDIESSECKEVWCVFGGSNSASGNLGPSSEMDRLYGQGLKAVAPPRQSDFLDESEIAPIASSGVDSSVRAMVNPWDAPFLLTAGSDRKIRFWDLENLDESYIVSGHESADLPPRYSSHQYGDIAFNIEYNPTVNQVMSPDGTTSRSSADKLLSPKSNPSSSSPSNTSSMPSVVNHLDTITDLAVTQVPYPMILAGGRDGVIKVWV